MKTEAKKTRVFKEGEPLVSFIAEHVKRLPDGAVLAITSKIVALAERRTRPSASPKEKEKLIRSESELAIPTKHAWLTVKDGTVMATAGIDESNADGRWILLPKDSFRATATLRRALLKQYKLKQLGIVITDSRVLPLRTGVTGVALGYAGFKGLRDYRGKSDIFGRALKMTQVNIADALATAAVLMMGEGDERQPLVVITDAPIEFADTIVRDELKINIKNDLYAPLFSCVLKGRVEKKRTKFS